VFRVTCEALPSGVRGTSLRSHPHSHRDRQEPPRWDIGRGLLSARDCLCGFGPLQLDVVHPAMRA
jgi:hypothetical protein